MKKIKYLICTVLLLSVLSAEYAGVYAAGYDGISAGNVSINAAKSSSGETEIPTNEVIAPQTVVYSPVTLKDRTCNFFATVDNEITVTLLSGERDYVNGDYSEYYIGAKAKDVSVYSEIINTLKTMTEINTNFKLVFVDPFSESIKSYLKSWENFSPEYGDLLISCYTDFDGNIKERKSVIKAKDFFAVKTERGKKVISGSKIENTLVTELKSLNDYRDINIGVIKDITASGTLDYLKMYLEESDYNFKNITMESENLNGYDSLLICAPLRDLTLSEVVLLDSYLEMPNKSLIYFAPRVWRSMPNLVAFLEKWGITVYPDYQLVGADKNDYFSKNTQFYASCGTPYFGNSKLRYIMDNCTPMEINENIVGVTVQTLLNTKGESCSVVIRNDAVGSELFADDALRLKGRFPLVLKAERATGKDDTSNVIAVSSADFINSYFALQNDKAEAYSGEHCGNIEFTVEILETVNNVNRNEPSGLTDYAVTLSDKGIETASGYSKSFIISVAVAAVIAAVAVLAVLIIIFGKRNRNAKGE